VARNLVLISCGQKFGQWEPEIKSEGMSGHQKFSGHQKKTMAVSTCRGFKWNFQKIIGFLLARNAVSGNLRSKLGSIKGFLVARHVINRSPRSKLCSIITMGCQWPEMWSTGA